MDYMQVADAGAVALVTEMAKSTWDSLRGSVSRLLRRDGEQSADQTLRLIDTARQELVDSAGDERGAVEQRVRRDLTIQLAAFLMRYPDAAAQLRELVDSVRGIASGAGPQTSVHHNTGSQVVISGGDINASGGIHYRAPEGNR